MAKNLKNKYPADKAGTKYSEFKNTKRVAPGKTRTDQPKQASTVSSGNTEQSSSKTA